MILGSFLGVGPTLKLKVVRMQCASCAILIIVLIKVNVCFSPRVLNSNKHDKINHRTR